MRFDFAQFIVRDSVYASGLRMPRHAHDYSNVSVVMGGAIDEMSDGREARGRAFSVVLKPAGSEHENRVGNAGARTLAIELRRGSALAATAAARPWSWLEGPEVVRAAMSLGRLLRGAASELEAASFALLAEVFAASDTKASGPAWLAEVTAMLERRCDEPLRFDDVAREIGVHPVYLSRAFRRYTGTTMQQHVRALRLRRACHLLATSPWSITDVAADCGFADASHLCRTFHQMLHVTPNVYRRLCVAAGFSPPAG